MSEPSGLNLAAFVAAMFFAGHRLSEWLWARSARAPLPALERACSSALLGIVLWLATTWALALAFHLRPGYLLAAAAAAAAAAIALSGKRRAPSGGEMRPRAQIDALALTLAPVLAWVMFLLWRGYVLPPHTPDALTYHLPRAAMVAKTGGFEFFGLADSRIDHLPPNYEMLLADFLVLQGTDTYTEWLSTLFFVLYLLQAAALAVRWWGPGRHVYPVALLVAGAPLLLLQGAAHKNDLMVGCLLLGALLWLGRFFRQRELAAGILLILAACAAAGTKQQGLLFALLAAPVVAWTAWRALRERALRASQLAIAAATAAGGFLLLGGYYYLCSAAASLGGAGGPGLAAIAEPVAYGAWANLWQVPLLALLAPFSASNTTVWVPWSGEEWLWERYDVHASNFGGVVSILALLLPVAAWLYRREPDREGLHERLIVTLIAALLAAAVLPINFSPHGYVSGFPRYLMFLPALAVCWTAAPALAWIERTRGAASLALAAATLACAALFADTALDVARYDKFAPLRDIMRAASHPGTRWVRSMPWRAASVLDCLAGPRDAVDFHAGHDSWIYPVFGVRLTRDVHFIRNAAQIRPRAQWVIVDRAYNVIWGDPDFKDISQWQRYLGRGSPRPSDLEVVEALLRDPSYALVFYNRHEVQAVFRRLPSPASAADAAHARAAAAARLRDLESCSAGTR